MSARKQQLMQRIRDLEKIEHSYQNLQTLLDYAAQDGDLDRYSGEMILEVDTDSGLITHANAMACEILGYPIDQLLTFKLHDLEVHPTHLDSGMLRYVETSIEKQIYDCFYRQADGHLLPVRVHRRLLMREGRGVYHFALEEESLRRTLWKELHRREDKDFHFREKLKDLNAIHTELGILDDFDQLCQTAIRLGMEKLSFDRLSIWFVKPHTSDMVGSYGTDEVGQIRDERAFTWSFKGTPIEEFERGDNTPVITQDNAPIYNHHSEIIGYGWHISVPLRYKGEFIGYMTADNYIKREPMKDYQPELLRLYGATIGHFAAHQRARDAAQKMAHNIELQHARVNLLETFINQVSHDFRTPLTIINTNAYLLSKAQDENRRTEMSQQIQDQVMYINRFLQQTLDVVKLESGLRLALKHIEINQVVDEVARGLEPLAQKKGLNWSITRDQPIMIDIDIEWFHRALNEVITNAIVYTEHGGRVDIRVVEHAQHVSIQVQDTGIGIPEAELGRIFTHLHRLDPARHTRGIGLGLTMAKLVIEAHGGQILVQSVVGQGSTFEITLPC